jgi:hypothetical protein
MMKIATLIWIILGATLAGIAFLVVLATPALATQTGKYGVIAIALGFVLALPASWIVAGKIAPKGL